MAKKKEPEDFGKKLLQSYTHWQHLYENGGSDPFWPDGVNLNLVRNHILYYKRQIEETMPPEVYPAAYHWELPPEVDPDYMAMTDEIRECARVSLARYQADPDYRYLCGRADTLSPKDVKDTSIYAVVGYAEGLGIAIEEDDLITMRRHRNPDNYLSAFSSCAAKVRNLKPPENEQLSFFYSYEYDEDEAEFEDDEMEL